MKEDILADKSKPVRGGWESEKHPNKNQEEPTDHQWVISAKLTAENLRERDHR